MNTQPARDALTRFSFPAANVRGALVQLDASWQEVRRRAQPLAVVEELLGESLAAVSLLKSTIQPDASVSLQLQSPGPLKLLFAQCNAVGALRGLARMGAAPESFSFDALAPLQARMAITLEPSQGDQRYQGIVALDGGNLSAALGGYFERSEQLPTWVLLAANRERAAGFLLQRLPQHGGRLAAEGWDELLALTATLTTDELLDLTPAQMLYRLFHQHEVLLQPAEQHAFGCSCSRERVGNMLLGLGREEAFAALTENHRVEVDCEFCNAHYSLDVVDIEALFQAALAPVSSLQ